MRRPLPVSLQISVDDQCSTTRILPHLYLGSKRLAADEAGLKALGITHIINCTSSKNIFPGKFTYLSLNISDSLDQADAMRASFQSCFDMINEARDMGSKCLVHCSAGMSRSACVVLAYLMSCEGMTLLQALATARRKRPQVSPNSGFMEALCQLETDLFDSATVSLTAYRMDRFSSAQELAIDTDSDCSSDSSSSSCPSTPALCSNMPPAPRAGRAPRRSSSFFAAEDQECLLFGAECQS